MRELPSYLRRPLPAFRAQRKSVSLARKVPRGSSKMLQESFEAEIAHVHATIAATPLREFAIPHLVIDNVFPADLVDRINDCWPDYDEGFFPEVPGNHILQLYRR